MNTTPMITYVIYRRYPETGWSIWKQYKKRLGANNSNLADRSAEIAKFLVRLGLAE